MLLIFVPKLTNRLGYTINVVIATLYLSRHATYFSKPLSKSKNANALSTTAFLYCFPVTGATQNCLSILLQPYST